jgi:signal transduction histidine kinase
VHSETDVVLDKDKLSNVIYHLASNAQQATGDDGFVRIDISQSDNLKQMLVKISDNGSGMSKDFIQRRLFKPFDTTKGNAGMGIGAYDAKLFMEQIGGYIQVKSEVGVGTTFTLIIPAD